MAMFNSYVSLPERKVEVLELRPSTSGFCATPFAKIYDIHRDPWVKA